MDRFEDPFDHGYGTINVEKNALSTLLRRYPRRGAPVLEKAFDIRLTLTRIPTRIKRAAAVFPPTRRILILGVEVPSQPEYMARVASCLPVSRHNVTFGIKPTEGRPKFDNLNDLLLQHLNSEIDWLIITDDDIDFPKCFLDGFIYLMERFEFKIGQPAHKLRSHTCYILTRRNWGTVARQTNFVEIGPLVALHRDTFADLLPFADVGMGWGLDYHWGLLAKKRGWRIGIIDALPIQHLRPIGSGYRARPALMKAKRFLEAYGGLTPREALTTIAMLRSF
jgi:hypothetical protein